MTAHRDRITGRFAAASCADASPEFVVPPTAGGNEFEAADSPAGLNDGGSTQPSVTLVCGESENTLTLRGRVTIRDTGALLDVALQAAAVGGGVRLDCSELSYLDTAAIQILASLRNELHGSYAAMTVTGMDPQVQRSLEAAGLWNLIVSSE